MFFSGQIYEDTLTTVIFPGWQTETQDTLDSMKVGLENLY